MEKLFKEHQSEDNDALMKINAAYDLFLESKKDEDLNEFVKEYLKKTDLIKFLRNFIIGRIKGISNVKAKTEEERIALEKAKSKKKE